MSKLSVGDKLPALTVDTAYRSGVPLYSLLHGRTVLWVLRYIGCTVCHYDVQVAADRYEELKARGLTPVFVMQSDQAHLKAAYPAGSLPFEIISDPEQKLYRELEILPASSMDALRGDKGEELKRKGARARAMGFTHGDYEGDEHQLPALFILSEEGVAEYVRYAENIVDLPDLDELLTLV